MTYGFPTSYVPLIGCPEDGEPLALVAEGAVDAAGDAARVTDGVVRCPRCAREYPITGGILGLVPASGVGDARAEHERQQRDKEADRYDAMTNDAELGFLPTLAAVRRAGGGGACLELGCGTGRFTLAMAERG